MMLYERCHESGFYCPSDGKAKKEDRRHVHKTVGLGGGSDTSLALVDWLLGRAKKGVVMCSALTAPQEGPAFCGLAGLLPVQKVQ